MKTEFENQGYCISTDPGLLDVTLIHSFLSTESYWNQGVPLEKVQRCIRHSLNFGLYHQGQQVGYARVISDFTAIAYLGDVFILSSHRGKGLGKWLIAAIMDHEALQGLRRWILLTKDAHGLYAQNGWQPILSPEKWMERTADSVNAKAGH